MFCNSDGSFLLIVAKWPHFGLRWSLSWSTVRINFWSSIFILFFSKNMDYPLSMIFASSMISAPKTKSLVFLRCKSSINVYKFSLVGFCILSTVWPRSRRTQRILDMNLHIVYSNWEAHSCFMRNHAAVSKISPKKIKKKSIKIWPPFSVFKSLS